VPVLFSAAEESLGLAIRELRAAFPAADLARVGPDLGALTGPDIAGIAAHCQDDPLVFVRHLTVETARVSRLTGLGPAAVSAVGDAAIRDGAEIAVQAWASGEPDLGYGAGQAAGEIVRALRDRGYTPTRSRAAYTLSCCLVSDIALIGLNRRDLSLSDWPGGRVRLGRSPDQISRAEFKLEELFDLFELDLPGDGRALDLGAAPGGWTRILRSRGLTVWAVDPGDLDPRLQSDRSIYHARTTAGEFLRSNRVRFDLVVNDMRMEPLLSCRMMTDAAPHLAPGGLAVVTLKTGTRRVLETVRACLDVLSRSYRIVHARQLHHNRHEVTVVLRAA
jgi:23S rRNA (cytidine2498-2'-O)-methyltransferase